MHEGSYLCNVSHADRVSGGRQIYRRARVCAKTRSVTKAIERIRDGKRYPDRIYRGRIVAYLRNVESAATGQIGCVVDPLYCAKDRAWLAAMLERLEGDEMIRRIGRRYALAK